MCIQKVCESYIVQETRELEVDKYRMEYYLILK